MSPEPEDARRGLFLCAALAAAAGAALADPPRVPVASRWTAVGVRYAGAVDAGLLVTPATTVDVFPPLTLLDRDSGRPLGPSSPVDLAAQRRFGAWRGVGASVVVLEHRPIPCPDRPACTTTDDWLTAFDPRTWRERWTVPLGPPRSFPTLEALAADRIAVDDGDRLRVFDALGREVWSRTGLYRGSQHDWRPTGSRVFLEVRDQISELELSDGAQRWASPGRVLAVDPTRLLYQRRAPAGWITVMRERSAGLERPIELPPAESIALGTHGLVSGAHRRIEGRDLTGRLRWARDDALDWVADGDTVYALSPGGVVRAPDGRTGRERWRWSVAEPAAIARIALRDGDGWVIDGGELVVLGRGRTSLAPTTIAGALIVDGRPRAGARISIGERVVRTDPHGRFALTVELPGAVGVAPDPEDLVPGPPPFECSWVIRGADPVKVSLTGGERRVGFEVTVGTYWHGI